MFFLDTNVIVDAIRGNYPCVLQNFARLNPKEIAIPSVVVAELEFGARHSDDYEKRRKQYLDFIAPYEVVAFSKNEVEPYGKLREQLTSSGLVIGSNDMLIAATALSCNAILVTHNVREFSRISGLTVVDWRL